MFVHRSPVIEIQGKELQGVKVTATHFLTGVLVCSKECQAGATVRRHTRTHAPPLPPTHTHTIIKPIMQCSK